MDNISKKTIEEAVQRAESQVIELELECRTLRTARLEPDFMSLKEKIEKDLEANELALRFAKSKLEIAKAIK
ncbi:MAG: hypothetical protein NUV80_03775 [Candidatus Berkelbacteria bacterium]|nr:hypothetical protein [Candidatus Berkelbacteria bacterium]